MPWEVPCAWRPCFGQLLPIHWGCAHTHLQGTRATGLLPHFRTEARYGSLNVSGERRVCQNLASQRRWNVKFCRLLNILRVSDGLRLISKKLLEYEIYMAVNIAFADGILSRPHPSKLSHNIRVERRRVSDLADVTRHDTRRVYTANCLLIIRTW
jgi:hypothetical protein